MKICMKVVGWTQTKATALQLCGMWSPAHWAEVAPLHFYISMRKASLVQVRLISSGYDREAPSFLSGF